MKIAIHQPEFLPYLGFFYKASQSDLLVILDSVQFLKNSFQNRNKIKTATGWQWLTVPVLHCFGQLINEVRINNATDWQKKHILTLRSNYNKAPYFKEYEGFLGEVCQRDWDMLAELNIYLIESMLRFLNINIPVVRQSKLGVEGKQTDLLISICQVTGADTYLSREGAKSYLMPERFAEEGIKLLFSEFHHPVYPQQFEQVGFQSSMSIIDLLFNCGPKSLNIIMGEQGA